MNSLNTYIIEKLKVNKDVTVYKNVDEKTFIDAVD